MQSLSAPDLVGLPEHELAKRALQPRGVYCRPGLLLPSDTTVYALLAAQDFNACLPLGPGRPLSGDGGPLLACRDTSTLAARANLQHRGAGDTRAFYVVQIELDMLTAPARPARHGDGGCSDSDDDDAPAEEAREPHAARRPPGGGMHGAPHAGGDARREASRGCDVRIGGGGVNEEAVTRVWMARRDARGAFLSCDAPTGDLKEWRSVFAAC